MSGKFIAFEGGEGSGKSTQAAHLADRLRAAGLEVVLTFEPGATERGARIRELLLDPAGGPLDPWAEALLYAADRAIHVAEVVRPALESGAWVVTDRFSDSYRAYQGAGRGLGVPEIGALSSQVSGRLEPDRVVVLDLPVEDGLRRIKGASDRLEREAIEFHERVRTCFHDLAAAEPERFAVVDASGLEADVAEQVWKAVEILVTDLR